MDACNYVWSSSQEFLVFISTLARDKSETPVVSNAFYNREAKYNYTLVQTRKAQS